MQEINIIRRYVHNNGFEHVTQGEILVHAINYYNFVISLHLVLLLMFVLFLNFTVRILYNTEHGQPQVCGAGGSGKWTTDDLCSVTQQPFEIATITCQRERISAEPTRAEGVATVEVETTTIIIGATTEDVTATEGAKVTEEVMMVQHDLNGIINIIVKNVKIYLVMHVYFVKIQIGVHNVNLVMIEYGDDAYVEYCGEPYNGPYGDDYLDHETGEKNDCDARTPFPTYQTPKPTNKPTNVETPRPAPKPTPRPTDTSCDYGFDVGLGIVVANGGIRRSRM